MAFLAPILAALAGGGGATAAGAAGTAGGLGSLAAGGTGLGAATGGSLMPAAMGTLATGAEGAGLASGGSLMGGAASASPNIMQLLLGGSGRGGMGGVGDLFTEKNAQGVPGWARMLANRPQMDIPASPVSGSPQPAGGSSGMPTISPLTMRLIQQYMAQIMPQRVEMGWPT